MDEKPCRVCASKIPIGANLCHVCKTHQAVWKARLQFFPSVTALIVASVSFTAWTISQLPALRAILFPVEDLHVVSLNSLHGGIVVNQGDKEVFLSHIMLKMNRRAPWGAQRFPITSLCRPESLSKCQCPEVMISGKGAGLEGYNLRYWKSLLM